MAKIKSIKVTARHLKDADFSSNIDCPLAKALKSSGFKDVVVSGWSATAVKLKRRYFFQFDSISKQVFAGKPFVVKFNEVTTIDAKS